MKYTSILKRMLIPLMLLTIILNVKASEDKLEVVSFSLNKDVRAQDDFYNFVNGNWEKTAKIPSDSGSWGTNDELFEAVYEQRLNILNGILKEKFEKNSDGEKIQALYKVYTNYEERERLKFDALKPLIEKIEKINSMDSFQETMIDLFITDYSQNPFYSFAIDADMANSNKNAVYLGGGATNLNSDYYQKDSQKNKEIISKYREYVKDYLKLYGYSKEEADKSATQIVNFEKLVSKFLLTNEESGDPSLMYNPTNMKDLAKLSKNIDLEKFLTAINIKTDLVVLANLRYFENIDSIVNEDNLEDIKEFLKFSILNSSSRLLHKEASDLAFDFYGKYLNGQEEQRSKEKRALSFVSATLSEPFGKLYVDKHFSNEKKEKALEMISYIKRATRIRLENLNWLTDETKIKALEKLDTLILKVGYPDKWEDYSELHIDETNNLFEINTAISKWSNKKELEKVGKDVDKTEWAMAPQDVNAYYNPLYNEIVFPAAILQEPFFYSNSDPAINFGGIGAVIAHEITHGFDSSGSQFNKDGNMVNWWVKEDLEKFNTLSQKLVKQFNQYEPIKGHFVNGEFTLNENIADLGGVNIAYDALQLYLKEKGEVKDIDGQNQNQRFFQAWTSIWKTISTDENSINLLSADNHSPGRVRAVAPLKNIDAFYETFDIKEGDKEFTKKEDRIKIW